jgi:hypothetical protein
MHFAFPRLIVMWALGPIGRGEYWSIRQELYMLSEVNS